MYGHSAANDIIDLTQPQQSPERDACVLNNAVYHIPISTQVPIHHFSSYVQNLTPYLYQPMQAAIQGTLADRSWGSWDSDTLRV